MDSTVLAALAGALIGALPAAFSAWYAARQVKGARHSAHGQFLLSLDEAMQRHQAVHLKLRGPQAEWGSAANEGCNEVAAQAYLNGQDTGLCKGPRALNEWAEVDA